MSKNLGPNCQRCLCSICANRLNCGIIEGNTDMNCDTCCKGDAERMTSCSDFVHE